MHEAVDNMLNHIHVLREPAHNTAIWCHIKEKVNWCVQDALKNIGVYVLEGLVDKPSHDEFLDNLAHRLEEHDNDNFEGVSPEFSGVFLL